MINDELLTKFESIQDLPISEEFLAAYDEGKLDPYERLCIEAKIENNPLIDAIISDYQNDYLVYNDTQDDVIPFSLDDINLPEIPEIGEMFKNIYSDINNLDFGKSIQNSVIEDFNNYSRNLLSSDNNIDQEIFIEGCDIFDTDDSSISSESPIEDDSINEDISQIDL